MRVLLYPYTDVLSAVVYHLLNEENTEQVKIVGIGNFSKRIEGADEDKIVFYDNFESALSDTEIIYIAPSNNERLHSRIVDSISFALHNSKCVIRCFEYLSDNELHQYREFISSGRIHYECSAGLPVPDDANYAPLDTIVVVIETLFSSNDDLYSVCCLRNEFVKRGYRVNVVSTSSHSKMFDFIKLPTEFLSTTADLRNAVISLNAFFNSVADHYTPDIIILHSNAGIMKYSELCHEDFGATAFLLSQSVNADYFILNSPLSELELFTKEDIHRLESIINYRFGYNLDAALISPLVVDSSESEESGSIVYNRVTVFDVEKSLQAFYKEQAGIILGSVNDKQIYRSLVDTCIDTLSQISSEL